MLHMGSRMGDVGQVLKQYEQTGEDEKEEVSGSFVPISEDPPEITIVPWEDFQNAVANLCSAASATFQVRSQREALVARLESALKIRKQYLHWIDELEGLKVRLKLKDLSLENAKVSLQENSEDAAIAKDKLLPSVRSSLAAAKSVAAAHNRLQDECRLLGGEGGQRRLLHLQNMLRARRRLMVSQIAAIYPIAPCAVPVEKGSAPSTSTPQPKHLTNVQAQTSDLSSRESQSVDKNDTLPMTIGGLHVVAPLNTKPNEPNDYESSATALGYVAHSLALLAACLDVPLRYPIRLGASRSYIQDYAPTGDSNEAVVSVGANSGSFRKSVIEFPLFSEGHDSTRSAYAVFLLNKDLEQVLNYMGAESVGPRHTLPNLNKIIQLVCSGVCTLT